MKLARPFDIRSRPILVVRRFQARESSPARGERRAASCARADATAQTEPAPDPPAEDLRRKHEAEKAELIDSIA